MRSTITYNISSNFPSFLGGQVGTNTSDFSGNDFGINGNHSLPWNGSVSITFNHSGYSGDFASTLGLNNGVNNYTTNIETAYATFRPTPKLVLYANQSYTDNLNGFLYQSITNSGGGVPLLQLDTQSNSSPFSAGANYSFTKNLYGQAQVTYYDQSYFGNNYQGTYFTGTVGYGKRILNTFTVSASVIESSNQFATPLLDSSGI